MADGQQPATDEWAERAILNHAEAVRIFEEARQMRKERDALAAIVRELAERGPFRDDDNGWCAHCWQAYTNEPHHHAPDCLWRRAKVLYPEPGA